LPVNNSAFNSFSSDDSKLSKDDAADFSWSNVNPKALACTTA
jgi:hypothetical protein